VSYPSFPSLPNPVGGSLEESSIDPWISDRGEVGAPRRRKRFTRALRIFPFSLRLTTAQKGTLLTFYDDTLDDGVSAFNWTHPVSGDVYLVRFAGRPVPRHFTAALWDVDVTLEQI
jgi:hypothetical protein